MQREPLTEHAGNLNRASYRKLVLALESARMRLAVAIATEAKMTPAAARRSYLEVDREARRLVKMLRALGKSGLEGNLSSDRELRMLRELLPTTVQNTRLRQAGQLCEGLRTVLAQLDETIGEISVKSEEAPEERSP